MALVTSFYLPLLCQSASFSHVYIRLSPSRTANTARVQSQIERKREGEEPFSKVYAGWPSFARTPAREWERATSSALARPRQQRVATVHLFALFLLIGNGRPRGALVFPRANRIRERASLSSLNVTLPLSLCLYTELAQVIIGLEPVQRHAIHKPFLSIYASTRERAGVLMSFSVPPISSSACDEFSRPAWTFCLRLLYYIILNF